MVRQIDGHIDTFAKFHLRLDGTWVQVPVKIGDFLGYAKRELKKTTLSKIIHPEDREDFDASFDKLKTGEQTEFETPLVLVNRNGNPVSVFMSALLIRDEDGEPDYVACHIQNLSSQENLLQKLEEREQQFNSLFKNNPHPVYYFDLEGNFEGVNQKLVEFTGLSREELLKKGFEEFIVEEDLERTKRQFKKAANGNSGQYEIRVKVKEGVKDIRVTKFPRYFGDEIIGVFGILQDITEEKRSKRELEKSEQHFKSLFERNPEAVYSFDKDGNFIEANKSLEKLTGYSIEELKSLNFEPLVAPDDKEKVWDRFNKAADGNPQTYEASGIHKDGHIFNVQVTNLPIYVDGQIIGVFGIAHDITQRKKAQKKLQESEQRWHQLVEQTCNRYKLFREEILYL